MISSTAAREALQRAVRRARLVGGRGGEGSQETLDEEGEGAPVSLGSTNDEVKPESSERVASGAKVDSREGMPASVGGSGGWEIAARWLRSWRSKWGGQAEGGTVEQSDAGWRQRRGRWTECDWVGGNGYIYLVFNELLPAESAVSRQGRRTPSWKSHSSWSSAVLGITEGKGANLDDEGKAPARVTTVSGGGGGGKEVGGGDVGAVETKIEEVAGHDAMGHEEEIVEVDTWEEGMAAKEGDGDDDDDDDDDDEAHMMNSAPP
ncbi:hypothetical protein CBR_g3793 [Chara braunii]|uniref:Uncharacterized protein n=1 Tax=Chara braunii TaxID=69332 RepID=A0A388KGC0_CHABU|nr:hypothetical protein CBR_g3793 [Chara braunii]|eukprot:GBG69095.1 hypothetical protein CBR_g3793 [Chara braunii]